MCSVLGVENPCCFIEHRKYSISHKLCMWFCFAFLCCAYNLIVSEFVLFIYPYSHYDDIIMSTMASQITSLVIVFSSVYSGADQRKHQSSVHWPLWGEFTGDRWIPHTKGQLRGKCFHLMTSSWSGFIPWHWSYHECHQSKPRRIWVKFSWTKPQWYQMICIILWMSCTPDC